jgi:signal transduction histidine kinase
MSLASIVINKNQNLIIGGIYISLYCLLAFITRSQFLFTNLIWIIAVVGGFSVSMFLFMRIVELSIDKQERLTTKVLLQNKELSTQANNLEEINKLLSQQAFEIKKQQRELQKLNSTKDKFFSLVAHDLKTPMSSIIGLLQIFENKYDALEDEKKRRYIQMIKSASVNTYALLDNLLEWSISQTKNIVCSPEKIRIDSIFSQIIELLDPAAKNKKIILRADCSDELDIMADEHMIVTVLRNLVSNGIKYTPENGSVVLRAERHKNYVQISVADTGVGMPKEIIESLFKIEKASSTKGTSGEPGTGLGLIISNDFLIKHHTHLKVKSIINEGTVFYFSLSLAV